MQNIKEERLWKTITIFVSIAGIVASVLCHIDGKNSTEKDIVEALSERYEYVDKEMSYEQALTELDVYVKQLENNNFELTSNNSDLQKQLDSIQNEMEYSEKITIAESYAATGDYETAIPILRSIPEKTEDITALLKKYTTNYENLIISNAEILANDGNFDAAVALINEALKIVPNNQTLINKRENITPKYLVDTIECYKAENLWLLDSQDYIKMSGKSYRHAIYSKSYDVGVSMLNKSYTANASYNLDGKYSQLSGTVGHVDFSGNGIIGENDSGQVYDAEITIWGDDIAISTITLSADDTAQDFNVPISGVKILEFSVRCDGNSEVGIAEIQIH